jgi:hypothetical protein
MSGQWKTVAKLAFRGKRFQDHALDLGALGELSQFQRLVEETTKTLWRNANPDRERLPRHFEEKVRLFLRTIEEGSAIAPMEVLMSEPQLGLFEIEPPELEAALDLAGDVFASLEADTTLPAQFPRPLMLEYSRLGESLGDNESIEMLRPGKRPARVTQASRARLLQLADQPHEAEVDLTGEVLEADVRQGRFQLWLDAKNSVAVPFSSEQEQLVTTALRDHRTSRLRITGRAEFAPSGRPSRITHVQKFELQTPGFAPFDPSARPIEEVLQELASQVPASEWKRLPSDLSDNLDHYIYGIPKR